jgi:formate dehydrogenase major subunit
MGKRKLVWPVLRQIAAGDLQGLGASAWTGRTAALKPRTAGADRVVGSVCPYCGVGCGQEVYVNDGRILDIEGDPASPISRGCLCPKGSATMQLVTGTHRKQQVLYRAPFAASWRELPLDEAMEMVAQRVKDTRDATWEEMHQKGHPLRRTLGIAHLGGATLDNEENYLIKKLFSSLGVVQVENQARI